MIGAGLQVGRVIVWYWVGGRVQNSPGEVRRFFCGQSVDVEFYDKLGIANGGVWLRGRKIQ